MIARLRALTLALAAAALFAAAPTHAQTLFQAGVPLPSPTSLGGVFAASCPSHTWIDSITISGVPTCAQPAFSDISGVATNAQIPAPTASALGGIESIASAAHNWIAYIDTSGVPHQSQPAFSDISGVATNAQIPAPTASALGGVESIASASHNWIAYIDTSGVPHQSQPGFGDLSGSLSPSQCPTFASSQAGCAPASGGGTANFLRADGSWAAPSGGGNVNGPGSSIAGHLPTFNGTGGTTLQDQSAVATGQDILMMSGRPWCDVRAEGAVGNGSTPDDSAINACLTILESFGSGGILYFPPSTGNYCTQNGITIPSSAPPITVQFAAQYTSLSDCNNDVTTLLVQAPYSRVISGFIKGRGANTTDTFSITHPALEINCSVGCWVEHTYATGGTHPIEILGGGDNGLWETKSTYPYSNANIYTVASANGAIVSGWMKRVKADDVFPTGSVPTGYGGSGSISAWATNTSYSLNQIVTNDDFYWQCTQAGTSANTGSGPQETLYNVTVTDNTAKWQMVSGNPSANILFDSGSYQWAVEMADMTGPHTYNLQIADNQSFGSSVNGLITVMDSTIGEGFSQTVNLAIGSEDKLIGNTVDSCFLSGCVLIYPNAGYAKELTIDDNSIYGGSYGLDWTAGAFMAVTNNMFSNITTVAILGATSGTSHGTFDNNVASTAEGAVAKFFDITGGPTNITMCGNDGSVQTGSNTISATGLVPGTYSTCNQ